MRDDFMKNVGLLRFPLPSGKFSIEYYKDLQLRR